MTFFFLLFIFLFFSFFFCGSSSTWCLFSLQFLVSVYKRRKKKGKKEKKNIGCKCTGRSFYFVAQWKWVNDESALFWSTSSSVIFQLAKYLLKDSIITSNGKFTTDNGNLVVTTLHQTVRSDCATLLNDLCYGVRMVARAKLLINNLKYFWDGQNVYHTFILFFSFFWRVLL